MIKNFPAVLTADDVFMHMIRPRAKAGAETVNVAIIVENRRSCKGDGATSPKTAKEVLETRLFLWIFTAFLRNSAYLIKEALWRS